MFISLTIFLRDNFINFKMKIYENQVTFNRIASEIKFFTQQLHHSICIVVIT